MKSLVFDAGPIISFTTNNLLHIMPEIKKLFRGKFIITNCVKTELIDKPLETKKFKFEALQVERMIDKGVFEIVHDKIIENKAIELLNLANNCFYAQNTPIKAFQLGEIESLAYACLQGVDAIVIDERTTRYLIENPELVKDLMTKRLHTKIKINNDALDTFQKQICDVHVLRSIELVTVAFEKGLLDEYIVNIPTAKKTLLESLLWGLKLNGAAVDEQEIKEILAIET